MGVSRYQHKFSLSLQKLATEAEYTLHACMYSPTENCFKGRIYESLPIKLVECLQKREVICPIEQVRNCPRITILQYLHILRKFLNSLMFT